MMRENCEDWTLEDRAERSPVLLVTIHAPQTVRLADSEFDSTVWSGDHEFLGHPIHTDPPLQHDSGPPVQTSVAIDVPDQLSADLLVNLEVGTPLTVEFVDPWQVPVGFRQLYVVTDSVDDGGRVTFGVLQAERQYVAPKHLQHAIWTPAHTRPRGVARIVAARLHSRDRQSRTGTRMP